MDLQEFAPVGGRTALLTIAAVVAVTVLSDACSQSPVGIHPPTHSSSTLAGRDEAVWRSMIADETHLAAADIPMTVFGSRWMLARGRQRDGMAIILPTHRRDSRAVERREAATASRAGHSSIRVPTSMAVLLMFPDAWLGKRE